MADLKAGDKVLRYRAGLKYPEHAYTFDTVAKITPGGTITLSSGDQLDPLGAVKGSKGLSRLLEPNPELIQSIMDLHERLHLMAQLMKIFADREFLLSASIMALSASLKVIKPAYTEHCREEEKA